MRSERSINVLYRKVNYLASRQTSIRAIMRSILYIIAVILVIGWLLGVFVYSAKGLIHILLVLAIISLLIGVIRRA